MIRLLIADDHATIRLGLERLLRSAADIEVVGSAGDGETAVETAARETPDVVLMDLQMPGMDGVEATRRILAHSPATRVIAFTSFAGKELLGRAIDAGVAGYLLKDASPRELLSAVRSGGADGAPSGAGLATAVPPARHLLVKRATLLTAREEEVLALVASGLHNSEAATRLGLSEGTVRSHMTHIFRKLGVSSRGQACLWAERNGLLEQGGAEAPT